MRNGRENRKPLPDVETLDRLFELRPNGDLVWKHRPIEMFNSVGNFRRWNTQNAGNVAGATCPNGRILVGIFGDRYYLSRIIWKILHGTEPHCIDHEDGNHRNNNPSNLRASDKVLNARNQVVRRDNKSGYNGVFFYKDKWCASVHVLGKCKSLGQFETKEEAIAARAKADKEYGFTPRPRLAVS